MEGLTVTQALTPSSTRAGSATRLGSSVLSSTATLPEALPEDYVLGACAELLCRANRADWEGGKT